MARRAALVTGASRGIGRAIAVRLAAEGFDLTLTARSAEGLAAVSGELNAIGTSEIQTLTADMASTEDVERLADDHIERFGRLDLLVLNAGTGTIARIEDTSRKRFDKQLEVNLRSPFLLIARCLPTMRDTARANPSHGARVVAISSITGVTAEPGMSVYAASKAALISLCETVNVENSESGVLATSISPGFVATDMSEWTQGTIPADTMIAADDIAELVASLARLSANAVVPNISVVRPGDNLWRA